MPGSNLEHQHDAVLPVGDAELAGFLQEQRDGDLMRAADHEARPTVQRIEWFLETSCGSLRRRRLE